MKTWTLLSTYFLAGSVCFAGNVGFKDSNLPRDGLFIGLGADANSVNITQDSWGEGISNIITSTGANSNGIGQGDGAPFHHTTNGFGPSFQAGYFKHIGDTPNYLGLKFLYQYIDATATNSNLYIPQIGQSTSAITGVTTPLFGYVNAASVQPTVRQDVTLLLFAGQSFGNASVYIGAGPSLVNLKSQNFNSIGYAIFDGVTINVTGLVNYSTPSLWAWGATGQFGGTYDLTPSLFLDMSYTYTITGNKRVNYQQTFTNTSNVGGVNYTTSGTLYTKNTMSVKNQSVILSINKIFDI